MTAPAARDYLADDYDQQGEGYPREYERACRDFAVHLRALPDDDPRMMRLARLIKPFLDDETRLGGTLYPDGDAVRFMDKFTPPTESERREDYLHQLLSRLTIDYRRWLACIARDGANAGWTLETGRPEVDVCLDHFEEEPTSTPPEFESWDDFVTRSLPSQVRQMCHARTKKANAARLLSDAPKVKLGAELSPR